MVMKTLREMKNVVIMLVLLALILAAGYVFFGRLSSDNYEVIDDNNNSSYSELSNLSEMLSEGSATIARVAERAGGMADELNEPTPIDTAVEQAVAQRNEQANNDVIAAQRAARCDEVRALYSPSAIDERQIVENLWASMSEAERLEFHDNLNGFHQHWRWNVAPQRLQELTARYC